MQTPLYIVDIGRRGPLDLSYYRHTEDLVAALVKAIWGMGGLGPGAGSVERVLLEN